MTEGRIKIIEGLNLLVEGLLDEASENAKDSGLLEDGNPNRLLSEAKRYIDQAENGDYYHMFFPLEDLVKLKKRYQIVQEEIEGME